MNNSELKVEINEYIDSLVVEGDRKGLSDLIDGLETLMEIAEDRLADLGGLDYESDDFVDDVPHTLEIDDGENSDESGDDLGDGVEDE